MEVLEPTGILFLAKRTIGPKTTRKLYTFYLLNIDRHVRNFLALMGLERYSYEKGVDIDYVSQDPNDFRIGEPVNYFPPSGWPIPVIIVGFSAHLSLRKPLVTIMYADGPRQVLLVKRNIQKLEQK